MARRQQSLVAKAEMQKLRREITKEVKAQYDLQAKQIKAMPKKGWNPLPYYFCLWIESPKRAIILTLLVIIGAAILTGAISINLPWFKYSKKPTYFEAPTKLPLKMRRRRRK